MIAASKLLSISSHLQAQHVPTNNWPGHALKPPHQSWWAGGGHEGHQRGKARLSVTQASQTHPQATVCPRWRPARPTPDGQDPICTHIYLSTGVCGLACLHGFLAALWPDPCAASTWDSQLGMKACTALALRLVFSKSKPEPRVQYLHSVKQRVSQTKNRACESAAKEGQGGLSAMYTKRGVQAFCPKQRPSRVDAQSSGRQ